MHQFYQPDGSVVETDDVMYKAQVVDGKIVNVLVFPSNAVPSEYSQWLTVDENTDVGTLVDELTNQLLYLPIDPELVNAERDRRMRLYFAFEGNHFGVDTASLQRITGAATLAGFAVAQGAQPGNYYWHGGTTPFTWITYNNAMVALDAHQMFNLGRAAAAHETAHIFAARALKDTVPIPKDYMDDKYWP